jgi:hypothetical protein
MKYEFPMCSNDSKKGMVRISFWGSPGWVCSMEFAILDVGNLGGVFDRLQIRESLSIFEI